MQLNTHRTRETRTSQGLLGSAKRVFATIVAFTSLCFGQLVFAEQPVNQFIVKFTPETHPVLSEKSSTDNPLFMRLSAVAKTGVSLKRPMSGQSHVIRLNESVAGEDLDALMRRLAKDPSIESIEPDSQILPFQIPQDTLFQQQWSLHSSAIIPAGMNLSVTWDLIENASETVVAIIDTGILPDHIDLQGRVLQGYDFISSFEVGDDSSLGQYPEHLRHFRTNDNDGRDFDASDPGDWIDANDAAVMQSLGVECPVQQSTFHGTAMAGIVAGQSQHNHGITGIDWTAKILPVRVSGKCGGSRSDMIDAIRWAAAISAPALPNNPTPAKVINLSLGSNTSCGFAEQAAIDEAWQAGAIVVAAAGNYSSDIVQSPTSPASCNNVVAVNAVRQDGHRAYYSNYGTTIDIAAPGGEDSGGDGKAMIVASNYGEQEPLHGSHYKFVSGTSGAAAHVSGVLSLMFSVAPDLSNEKLVEYLLTSTSQFTQGDYPECNKQSCGSGVVNAYFAVRRTIESLKGDNGLDIGNAGSGATDTSGSVTTGTNGGGCSVSSNQRGFDPVFLLLILSLLFIKRRRAR